MKRKSNLVCKTIKTHRLCAHKSVHIKPSHYQHTSPPPPNPNTQNVLAKVQIILNVLDRLKIARASLVLDHVLLPADLEEALGARAGHKALGRFIPLDDSRDILVRVPRLPMRKRKKTKYENTVTQNNQASESTKCNIPDPPCLVTRSSESALAKRPPPAP